MRLAGSIVLAVPLAAATALAQDVRPATGPWERFDASFGPGVASCFTSEETGNYWCFAVRCSAGGVLEFAHFYAGGDPAPEGALVVDDEAYPLDFVVVRPFEEHVAPLPADAPALAALKSGSLAAYVSAEGLHFPIDLTGAAEGIAAVEAECR